MRTNDSQASVTEITATPLDPAARMGYVDGLRGIAILTVVLFHSALYAPPLANRWLRHALEEGKHGIDLFFVLSGFCLSYAVLARVARGERVFFDLRTYAATRLVRIVPPFWIAFAIIVALAAGAAAIGTPFPSPPVIPVPSVVDYLRELTLLYPHGGVFVNGSFWSLAVESRWYFVLPVAILLWVRARRAFFALAAVCVVHYAFTEKYMDVASLPAFLLGIVAADAEVRARAWRRWALPAALAAMAFALLLETRAGLPDRLYLPWQLAAFFLVVAGGYHARLRRALCVLPLSLTGLASYGIYLVHEPLVAIAERRFGVPLLGGFTIALAAGALFFVLFERPFVAGRVRDGLRAAIVRVISAPLPASVRPGLTIGRKKARREASLFPSVGTGANR